MSVIVVVLEGERQPQAAVKICKALGLSLHTLRDSWLNGRPVVEMEIFEGDYLQKSKIIRIVLKIIEEEGLGAKFYEIPFGEKYSEDQKLNTWAINAQAVVAILDAADKEVERQLGS